MHNPNEPDTTEHLTPLDNKRSGVILGHRLYALWGQLREDSVFHPTWGKKMAEVLNVLEMTDRNPVTLLRQAAEAEIAGDGNDVATYWVAIRIIYEEFEG